MKKYKLTFLPDNKTVEIEKGKTVLSAAISAGIHINSSCGGDGACGRCKVILRKGKIESLPTGKITLAERKKGYYLACSSVPDGDAEIEIPKESRLDSVTLTEEDIRILDKKAIYTLIPEQIDKEPKLQENIFKHSPLATKLYLELPKPTLDDKISDLERLYRAVSLLDESPSLQTGLKNIRKLGEVLRLNDWKVTVTLGKRNDVTEIVLIEPGNSAGRNYGFAFDIGTTTISGQLIDLNAKRVLGTRTAYNMQASFGSDVITRIIFAQAELGLLKLHHAVVDQLNLMIEGLIKEHAVDIDDVTCCLCAGNTTMMHLLLKVDPTYIRREPYVPTANFVPVIRAGEAGVKINPRGLLACVPGVSSYVGGDITAGVLACGMDKTDKLCLLIDIGTNGEVALGNKDWIISCAASAGPAFEGSGVVCGMRASSGAIQKVHILPKTFEVVYSTISNVPPIGICGSGYIDLLAELVRCGIIDKNGKFDPGLPNRRIRKGEYGPEFVVCSKKESGTAEDIVINEADIENLKRAKGAIYAACSLLISHMGFAFNDIEKIFIGGGFGTYVDTSNAVTIGLLPDVPKEKLVFVGNSSLSGARQILLSYDAFIAAAVIAKKMTYLELSAESKYMEEYVAALFFPHTDLSKFPSVKV